MQTHVHTGTWTPEFTAANTQTTETCTDDRARQCGVSHSGARPHTDLSVARPPSHTPSEGGPRAPDPTGRKRLSDTGHSGSTRAEGGVGTAGHWVWGVFRESRKCSTLSLG